MSRWPDCIARHRCQHLSFPGGQDWSKDTVWSTALVNHCVSLKAFHCPLNFTAFESVLSCFPYKQLNQKLILPLLLNLLIFL